MSRWAHTVTPLPDRILGQMPRVWKDAVDLHRREVRGAIVAATAALIERHGLLAVTMSRIATETGIARATLYKHFPDVEAIVLEWHGQQVSRHLEQLANARDRAHGAAARIRAVLDAYARVVFESAGHQDSELGAFVHGDDRLARSQEQLRLMVRSLLLDAVRAGDIRADVDADELAGYCLHALAAARTLRSRAAVSRLVAVTFDGLRLPSA